MTNQRKKDHGVASKVVDGPTTVTKDYSPTADNLASAQIIQSKSKIPIEDPELRTLFHGFEGLTKPSFPSSTTCQYCPVDSIDFQKTVIEFEKWVLARQSIGSPRTDHLLILVKFNVFRALISNCMDLGLSFGEIAPHEALSPFTDPRNPKSHIVNLPTALQPTKLQKEILHHPWIDQLPIPRMRDNLLRATNMYDEMELCRDLVGFFSASNMRAGLVVWGEPWDPSAWEVTESFLIYWGWTIKGCLELVESTNQWRRKRGEDPLDFGRDF